MPVCALLSKKIRAVSFLLIVFIAYALGNAQAQTTVNQPNLAFGNTINDSSLTLSTTHQHSPRTALLLSIVPGGGQIYNHQAWKLPIIYAGLGVMSYVVWNNYSEMMMFKNEYLYRTQHSGATQLEEYASYPTTNIYNLYQSKSKDFQLYLFIDIAFYALNMVDAYVFAHLFDFEINDDLSLLIQPMTIPTIGWGGGVKATPSLSFTLRF